MLETVEAFIWIGLLMMLSSRRVFLMVRSVNPDKAKCSTHMGWAKVFAGRAHGQMRVVIESNGLEYDMWTWWDILESQGCDPNVKGERLMEDWIP